MKTLKEIIIREAKEIVEQQQERPATKRDLAKAARDFLRTASKNSKSASKLLRDIGDRRNADKADIAEKEAREASEDISHKLGGDKKTT